MQGRPPLAPRLGSPKACPIRPGARALAEGRQDKAAPAFDEAAHVQTWQDMLRPQTDGVCPQVCAAFRSPALMLHGEHDLHPGEMIRDRLSPYLPQLEYRALERCGHSPWTERFARDEFLGVLKAWLARRLSD
jgi:pimeloyl-ACP methyl ester carboxylesterase